MKIITIEGLDGSGKGTQSKILKENLEKTGKKVALFSFPVYESYTGGKVKKYLTGELKGLGILQISELYSNDRKAFFKKELKNILEGNYDYVIFDRYVFSNIIHQGMKLKTEREINNYVKTVYHMEYTKNEIPKPDIEIFLEVSNNVRNSIIENRMIKEESKDSTIGKMRTKDIHENDTDYLDMCHDKINLLMSNNHAFDNTKVLKCDDDLVMRSIDEISSDILKIVLA